jgi:hypothetical protein
MLMASRKTTTCDLCGIETKPAGGPDHDAASHMQVGGVDLDACRACVRATQDFHRSIRADPKEWLAKRAEAVDTMALAVELGQDPLVAFTRDEIVQRLEMQRAELAKRAAVKAKENV